MIYDQPGIIHQVTGSLTHALFWEATVLWTTTLTTATSTSRGEPYLRKPPMPRKPMIAWNAPTGPGYTITG